MKKFKKLQKGMTLVEVIVAMSIFSIGTAAVTMAFAAAVKYNTYNQRRDEELSIQQAELQSGNSTSLEVYNGYVQSNTLVFKNGGTKLTFDEAAHYPYVNISEYQAARSGKNDTKFDFQLKTFSSTPLGQTDAVVYKKDENKYKFTVTNQSSLPIDVKIEALGGDFYTGAYDTGYRHPSNTYWSSLASAGSKYTIKDDPTKADDDATLVKTDIAPSSFEVGYYNPSMDTLTDSPVKFLFYKEGFVYAEAPLSLTSINGSTQGVVEITIDSSGSMPTLEYK